MKKTIRDYDLNNKKVIIRVDFNVPIKEGIITDDNRIVESLPTIEYAIKKEAKIILMSHLGRVKTIEDKKKNSLEVVAERLSELLKKPIMFATETRGEELENSIKALNPGEILLMENTRFEDLIGEKESKNDSELGAYWASLGELFINDAFGTAHRAHASNVGIASHLPNGIGFLIEKEITILGEALKNPKRPFTVILGGSKVSDKIGVIENLVKVADNILIGGGMSYTFLKAEGKEIGKSLLDEESLDFCEKILENNHHKIILPIDTVVTKEINEKSSFRTTSTIDINDDEIGVDIGPATIKMFQEFIEKSKTIIWNGPLGIFEINKFSKGTKEILEILSNTDATIIIGGGDTAAAAINFGYKKAFTHIATGGGATLEMMEGKELPGIKVIDEK